MATILATVLAIGLILQALIGMAFFISSIFEKEKRASFFGGVQLFGMILLAAGFIYMYSTGLFNSLTGVFMLSFLIISGTIVVIFFSRKTSPNEKALAGTKGYIADQANRFDERDHVFSRNRSLLKDSEQYAAYYKKNPEFEEIDSKRREKGGPTGRPGSIDNPYSGPNIAATLASANLSHFLSKPDMYSPEPHIALKEKLSKKKIDINPEEATVRLKGYAKALGASLVGVTKINPLWVYSHRGEIFNNNWED